MNDKATVSKVIIILGIVVVVGVIGLIWLISGDKPAESLVPLVGITTGALGGLTGILASTNSVDLDGLAKLKEKSEVGDPQ